MKTYQLGSRDRMLIAKKKKGVTIQQKDSNKYMELSSETVIEPILENTHRDRIRNLLCYMCVYE